MKVGKKWKNMAPIYLRFSLQGVKEGMSEHSRKTLEEYNSYRDTSEEAMYEAFARESFGEKFDVLRSNGKINAYIEGKQWMDLTMTEYWLPDLRTKSIFAWELYLDFPKWFLDKVLPEEYHMSEEEIDGFRS